MDIDDYGLEILRSVPSIKRDWYAAIAKDIIASRKANPEARCLALEEAVLELEWMARGLDGYGAKVAMDAAQRIRGLASDPQIGAQPDCSAPVALISGSPNAHL